MNIVLNGEQQQVPDNLTAAQLVESLGLTGKRLAMEVYMEIVPRSTFQEFVIHPMTAWKSYTPSVAVNRRFNGVTPFILFTSGLTKNDCNNPGSSQ